MNALLKFSAIISTTLYFVASTLPAGAQTSITTWQANLQHTGENLTETTLTPAIVGTSGNMGLLFSQPTDGQSYGQPLLVSGVNVGGTTHNLVFVATEHDSVYAYDADNNTGGNANAIWHDALLPTGTTPVPQADVGSGDISIELGITATPVIDAASSTLYIVSKVKRTSDATYHQYLHALDLATGAEKFNGPVEVNPTFAGSASDGTGGVIPFSALHEHDRAALVLYNGIVYISYASHSDTTPYHGEVIGYNASTLALVSKFLTSPNGVEGGLWGAGAGPAVDSAGNMYLAVANGPFDQTASAYTPNTDWGESFLKLPTNQTGQYSTSFSNTMNWFTPNIWNNLNGGDLDLGSGGVLLLPDQTGPHTHIMVGGGKGAVLYVVDRDNMGGLHTPDNAIQEISEPNGNWLFVTPAYHNGYIYYTAAGGHLEQRTVGYNATDGSYIAPTPITSSDVANVKGSGVFITSNGNNASSGIVWLLNGNLRAYNASDVSSGPSGGPIYSFNPTLPGNVGCQTTKFTLPMVANGKVYFTAFDSTNTGHLFVMGLTTSSAAPAAPSNVQAVANSGNQITVTWADNSNNESGFKVKRSTSLTGTYSVITTTGANVTQFVDTGLTPNTTYYYQIAATDSSGDSPVVPSSAVSTFPYFTANGLVAYWNLDENGGSTANDITGNGHTGTVNGEVGYAAGNVNSALSFHGTGNATLNFTVPNSSAFQFTASQSFTLSAWVFPSALRSSEEAIIAKSADQGNKYGIWINAANQWVFRGPGSDLVGPAATESTWTHVAVVQDGTAGTRKIYINGALAATGTAQAADGAGALWVAQENVSTALDSFPGEIDEIRLYSRALAASEITTLLGAPVLEGLSVETQGGAVYGLPIAPSSIALKESRKGATVGSYNLQLSFAAPVSGLTATLGKQGGGTAVGSVQSVSYDNTGKVVTVALTGVGNSQALNIHLTGVAPGSGTADIPFNVLWGDVNGDNVVTSLDATIVQKNFTTALNSTSAIFDVNCDGVVNAADVTIVTAQQGTSLGTQTDANLALYGLAAASSSLSPNTPDMAFDNKGTNLTRWESIHAVDPQWISVDLGAPCSIHSVVLNWENAAGQNYTIDVSNDNTNWTNVVNVTGNATGGIKTYAGLNASGRYVRMFGTTRTGPYGYSLWEFQVFGLASTSGTGGNPPSITSTLTSNATVGAAYSYQITGTNSPTSYNATGLPTGLSVNTSTGVISGTPTAAGTSNVTISATNASGTGTAALTLTTTAAGNAPVINSALTSSGTVGTAYTYQITATNAPTSYNATGLPAGLTVNTTTGAITGTPTAAGSSNVTISATNATGTGTATLALTVTAAATPPVINSSLNASGTVGTAFTYQIAATNNPTSFNATGLPAGLTVNTSTGVISGTPTAGGSTNVSISATNTSGTGTASLGIVINATNNDVLLSQGQPASASSTNGANTAAMAFDGNLTGTRWESVQGVDPQWIYVDLGAIDTIHSITLTWETAAGQNYNLQVSNDLVNWTNVAVVTGNAASGALNYTGLNATGRYVRMYGTTRATGYGYSLYEFQVFGLAGTPIDSNVALNKLATASSSNGTNTPNLAVDGNTGTRWESLAADPQWIKVDLGAVYNIDTIVLNWETAAGQNYTLQVSNDNVNWTTVQTVTGNATAGVLAYPGLATSGRYVMMSGTTRATTFGYSLWDFQVLGYPGSGSSTPAITSSLTSAGTVGTAYSYQIAATNTPTSFNATGLPAGLTVNTTTGVISGTPTAAGTSNVALSATNASGTGTATVALTVTAASNPPVINSALTSSGTMGTAYSYQIAATNTPTSFNATGLPAGLTVNTTTGVISGTPTAAGSSNVTISATNASGTGSATLALTVNSTTDTNVALNKTATASSFQVGNLVANANDGNSTGTRWSASDATYPQWWMVDLGANKTLSRCDIAWYGGATRAYKYKIEVSTDNVNFTTVKDNTGNTTNGNTSDSFTATAHYVRITVTGSSAGWASAYEFAVYGH